MSGLNNLKVLHETDQFIVGHIFETAFVIDKSNAKTHQIGDLYGDPSCALIDRYSKWCVVAGSTLFIWTPDKQIEIRDNNLYWACKLRQVDTNVVHVLVDPWSDNSSIWELNVITTERRKIRDVNHYRGKEFTEIIDW